jgi:hypothetical protein
MLSNDQFSFNHINFFFIKKSAIEPISVYTHIAFMLTIR